ncbi:MAG: UMP kinase [Nanoarchaeota archaeon]
MKKLVIMSLGGSIIIPEDVDKEFLLKFKKLILRNTNKCKFIIVCGGGSLARKYIAALKDKPNIIRGVAGISATRTNAKFMSLFFDQDPEKEVPRKFNEVRELIKKQDIVFCGGLELKPHQTTDTNAADLAAAFKVPFINLTNVLGLYDKNPRKNKSAKFISRISWKEFHKMANSIKFEPGQHFVLDQEASEIILKNKITTYILGKNAKNLENYLNGKSFKGTVIEG